MTAEAGMARIADPPQGHLTDPPNQLIFQGQLTFQDRLILQGRHIFQSLPSLRTARL
jgi:hypothetical protein